jgi:integrase/recombinase XerD
MPRLPSVRLPRSVLTAAEAERVMRQPGLSTPLGIRDRAMLETLYSTGMRRIELLGLKIYDIDVPRGTVMIREGKGKKDRVVPIGERALHFIDKYLQEVRPGLAVEPEDGTLFLMSTSEPFGANYVTKLVRDYVLAARIGKPGACHLFRHTMATLMLENGADIRFIQEMLGHAKLATTQIYTQVSIKKLKEIHTATHPAARLAACDHAPAAAPEELGEEASAREDLLLTLAAEAEEEDD